jgi:hypothetical protein
LRQLQFHSERLGLLLHGNGMINKSPPYLQYSVECVG